MAKSTRKFDRRGNVVAYDSKYTGEEPVWPEEGLYQADFMRRRNIMLGFYNYYLDKQSLLPDAQEWMKRELPELKIPGTIAQTEIPFTVMKLMRAHNRGMPLQTEETDDYQFILDGLQHATNVAKMVKGAAKTVKATPVVDESNDSPVVAQPKGSPELELLMCDLEQMYDKWVSNPLKPVPLNLEGLVTTLKIKKVDEILKWFDKNLDELKRALDRQDEFAIEGYKFLKKHQIRKWIKLLEDMREGAIKGSTAKRKQAPRKKKVKTPGEQTKHLKFAEKDETTGIATLPMASVIGAKTVILYNTKYRDAHVLKCTSGDGFHVKGQSMQDVADTSYAIKIRKPEVDLKPLKESKNPDKYIKGLKVSLKKANARFNDNIIVLYAK